MNLERILAENMLRFGTKNLGDTINKIKYLIEGLGAGDGVGTGVQIPADVLTAIQRVAPKSTAYKDAVTQLSKMKIPILCNGNIIDALIYGAMKGNAVVFGNGTLLKLVGSQAKFDERMLSILDTLQADSLLFDDIETISLNPDPADPTKVATMGEVTPAMGVGGSEETGSDYTELLTFLNTFNLMNIVEGKWNTPIYQYFYLNKTDNGYLNLNGGDALQDQTYAAFYATQQAGQSKASKQISNTKFIPIPGDTQKIPIPKDTFPKGTVIVADAPFKTITDTLTNFQQDEKFGKAGWTITGIKINTAASLGETVNADINGFSKMTGVSVDDLNTAGITNNNVKDPVGLAAGPAVAGRSGQDFLAITRANNIKSKLEAAFPGIPITTVPVLAAGKEESRYGEVNFSVQGPNKEIQIPAEMTSTGKVGASQDLGKFFNCNLVESRWALEKIFSAKDKGYAGAEEKSGI